MKARSYLVSASLVCSVTVMLVVVWLRQPMARGNESIVDYCKSLPEKEYLAYIVKLGKEGKCDQLAHIYNSSFPHSSRAAAVAAEAMRDEEVVGFCTKFDLDSPNWRAAFHSLDSHRKDVVVGYVRQLITSNDPDVRFACYTLCRRARWPDLLEFAKEDLACQEVIQVSGAPFNQPLSYTASLYIKTCEIAALKNRETKK